MYEDKKDTNFLLVLFTSIIYVFIAIFVIFFIGLSKVDAALPINFVYSENMRNITGTSSTSLGTVLNNCTNTNFCDIPSSNIFTQRGMIANFTRINSNVKDETYLIINGNNYSINYTIRLYKTNSDIIALTPSIAVFNTSSQWLLSTCDSGVSYQSQINSEPGSNYTYVQTFSYRCNRLDSTVNGNTIRLGAISSTTSGALSGVVGWEVATSIIDNSRPANDAESIIQNDNVNTDKIINNAIQNQQQTNQGLQDIEDALTNSDTSSSNDTIGGFFGSFSDTDHGGLSGIITAPLIAFNQMLTGTCNDLSVEYKGSTTILPCGTSFWNQISPIRDFLNITLGGLICYQIVRKLFLLIQKIKNPDDDRVEVMSL